MNQGSKVFTGLEKIKTRVNALRGNPWFSRLLFLLSILYLLALLFLSRSEVANINWRTVWVSFLVCMGLYYLSMLFQCLNWSLILHGHTRDLRENSEIYFKTLLMRRLPGGFWHWLGRSNLYGDLGTVNSTDLGRANLSEWLGLILTGLSCFVATINVYLGLAAFFLSWLILAFGLGRQNKSAPGRPVLMLFILAIYIACWVLGALILNILLNGIIAPANASLLLALKVWSLSGAVATLAFFMPNGALIREFTLSALLTPWFELPKVIMLALQIRIIFTISDILFALLSLQILKWIGGSKSRSTAS
ncbi:MAG: hypothetical protein VB029_06635 [Anaerolineaceae bacterium]|jgi:hypothetical protein|nr:hypothetical protein [Anaerolineaceae bacterium]HPT24435.1 hypothetical protein [Anaerolineaceae bacterium]